MIVKIVSRAVAVLAFLGVAALLAIVVLLAIAGAGKGHSVENTPIGGFVLGIALPICGVALVLALLLALLNAIGIQPWFDPTTARFVRPTSAADWATKIGGLVAGLLLPVTGGAIALGIAILAASDVDPDEWSGPLVTILLAGVVGSIAVAGVAAVMGWFGVVAGLLLGAGFVGVVGGTLSGVPAATVLGVISLALSVGCYYAGGRLKGTIPHGVASYTTSGGLLLLGAGFFVVSALTHDLLFVVGGVAAVSATAGYLVGGLLGRARNSATG